MLVYAAVGLFSLVAIGLALSSQLQPSEEDRIEVLKSEIRDDSDRIYKIEAVDGTLVIDVYLKWPGDNSADKFADEMSDIVQDVSKSGLEYEELQITVNSKLTTPSGQTEEIIVATVEWKKNLIEAIEWTDYDKLELVERLSSSADFHNPGYRTGYTETPPTTTSTTAAPESTTTTAAPATTVRPRTAPEPFVALDDRVGAPGLDPNPGELYPNRPSILENDHEAELCGGTAYNGWNIYLDNAAIIDGEIRFNIEVFNREDFERAIRQSDFGLLLPDGRILSHIEGGPISDRGFRVEPGTIIVAPIKVAFPVDVVEEGGFVWLVHFADAFDDARGIWQFPVERFSSPCGVTGWYPAPFE